MVDLGQREQMDEVQSVNMQQWNHSDSEHGTKTKASDFYVAH